MLLLYSSVDHGAAYTQIKEVVLKALSLWHYKGRNIYHLAYSEGSILGETQILRFSLILPSMQTMLKLPNYSPL